MAVHDSERGLGGAGEAGRRLRAAVAGGDYAEANRLVETYREELDQELKSVGPERAAALCAEAREVLKLARKAVLAERTRSGEGLARLVRIRYYGSPRPKGAVRTNLTI